MAAKNDFAHKLAELLLSDPDLSNLKQADEQLKETFLASACESPDNLSCADYIEYGAILDESWGVNTTVGLKLKRHDIMLSDISNVLENCAMPPELKAQFPKLTGEDWDAAMRMMTMILMALERKV